MTDWGALNARAAGLATGTWPATDLRRLADLPDAAALANAIERRAGEPLAAADSTPAAIELSARRMLTRRLGILARWSGPGGAALAVIHEEDDRDNLRALVRGALQGAEPSQRLAGLVPTPSLPSRRLDQLARLDTVAAIRTLLGAWGSPYAADVTAAEGTSPDLQRFERALARRWAARSVRAARRGGRRLRVLTAEVIDIENVLIVVAAVHGEEDGGADLLDGGRRLTRDIALDALVGRDPARAGRVLAACFAGTAYAAVLRTMVRRPERIEQALRGARLRALALEARLAPLGPAPFLLCLMRFRLEVEHLRRLAWGLSLGWRGRELADLATDAA